MKKNKEIIALIIGLVLAVAVFLTFKFHSAKRTDSYDIVFFGDSRIVGAYSEKTIPDIVSEAVGMTSLNAAFGGTALSVTEPEIYGDRATVVSGVYLSKNLVMGDYSALSRTFESASRYFEDNKDYHKTATLLSKTDFTETRYIILAYGANDYLAGVPVDDDSNPYSDTTFGGALRTSVKNIEAACPEARIILVTPAFIKLDYVAEDCNEIIFGGGYLYEYSECMLKIADEFGIKAVDCFKGIDINKENYEEYLVDGLHFNDAGIEAEADLIIAAIKELEDKK